MGQHSNELVSHPRTNSTVRNKFVQSCTMSFSSMFCRKYLQMWQRDSCHHDTSRKFLLCFFYYVHLPWWHSSSPVTLHTCTACRIHKQFSLFYSILARMESQQLQPRIHTSKISSETELDCRFRILSQLTSCTNALEVGTLYHIQTNDENLSPRCFRIAVLWFVNVNESFLISLDA